MTQFVAHDGERERYATVLDDFIGWSLKHPGSVTHTAEYEQDAVAFTRTCDGLVLWSAYPRRYDGARFELLPGKASSLSAELRQEVLAVMQPLSEEPELTKSKIVAPFLKLKRAETRQKVMVLLDRLLAV